MPWSAIDPRQLKVDAWSMSIGAQTITYAVGGALVGAIVGPPLGLWSVRFEHALARHRARCGRCQLRAEQRLERPKAGHV
jgi:hypothetical protein